MHVYMITATVNKATRCTFNLLCTEIREMQCTVSSVIVGGGDLVPACTCTS